MSGKNSAVNWDVVFENVGNYELMDFSQGLTSGRQLYEASVFSPAGGQVRSLLRTHGVNNARQLARKALKRRGLV